jgi:hopene-associated glycosyltransferase HpnB
VAVIVPARDEAAMLPETLPSLLAQDYPGPAWVVLVDDQSTDGTAPVARELAAAASGGLALRVVEGGPRPDGWAGKPWAMAQGVRHALSAPERPEWFLFTDADIRHSPSSLRQLVGGALGTGRASVSLMARLSVESFWERLLMPAFVYFFAQIYPFPWVNDSSRRTAAAAGGCLLVEAAALERAGGVEAIAASSIDDVALAKALKKTGASIWLGLAEGGTDHDGGARPDGGPSVESLRRYPDLADTWDMVARSAYIQLGCHPLALAGALAGLGLVYISPPVLAVVGAAARRPRLAAAGATAWAAMALSYLPMARYYRVAPATAVALPFTASLYAAMTVSSAWRFHRGRLAWKGRGPAQAAPRL